MSDLVRDRRWVVSKRLVLELAITLIPAVAATQSAQAQAYSVLHSFEGSPDGANPYGAGVVRDAAGNLYGTSYSGGANGGGVVYKLSKTNKEIVLYNFCSQPSCTDGAIPFSPLTRDAAGNIYGTTVNGGTSGDGTVFKLDKSGNETVLYSFCSRASCADGANPYSGVIRDTSGNLYGTTVSGGASGDGTVFRVSGTGMQTVLYSFAGGADGANPYWGVIRDAEGNLYGTTTYGGAGSGDCSGEGPNCGTVFKLSEAGTETVLYTFRGGVDGGSPNGGLMLYGGDLYGTAYYGGTFGYGTVFKVSMKGKESVLHDFDGSEGSNPFAGLIRDADGNIYGTTYGDQVPYGTVFELSSTGIQTLLYSFTGGSDGAHPAGSIIRDTDGNLYGTTRYGGTSGFGVVFKLTAQ